MAKMTNATFAWLFTLPAHWYANAAFTIFAIFFLLNIYIFETYLQEANLCKSIQIRPVKDQGAR